VIAPEAARYIDAVRIALEEVMADDETVVLLGQDISGGGPFGATIGLAGRFGAARVRDTPISEAAVAGMAVGAALLGKRPVLELMFIDFITLALDQLVNHAAKLRYTSGGQLGVPLTVRVQAGAAGGFGAHHSQSLEAWLTHVPGLRVLAPSTPSDARGMLVQAIRSSDPTIVIEHRGLYWDRGLLDPEVRPATEAVVRRPGSDVTIVSWSKMVGTSLAAAELLRIERIEAEVIDLRSLSPIDVATVAASVARTGRLVVAAEAVAVGGLGGEVAFAVAERAGASLRAPVARIGAPFAPVPAAIQLERAYVPGPRQVADAARGGRASRHPT